MGGVADFIGGIVESVADVVGGVVEAAGSIVDNVASAVTENPLLAVAAIVAPEVIGFEALGADLMGDILLPEAFADGAISTVGGLAEAGGAFDMYGMQNVPGISEYGTIFDSQFVGPLADLEAGGAFDMYGAQNVPGFPEYGTIYEQSLFPNLSNKDLFNIGKTALQLINKGDSQSLAAGRKLLSNIGYAQPDPTGGFGTTGGVGGIGGINWLTNPSKSGILTHGAASPLSQVQQAASSAQKEGKFPSPLAPASNLTPFNNLNPMSRSPVFGAADGGSVGPFEEAIKVMEKLSPKFTPAKAALLSYKPQSSYSKSEFSGLSPLKHIYPSIIRSAKGGLPREYHEATPKGHDPEFITGLTGYYADGKGTGQSDDIPALLHDGDYVMDAETVSALGDGSSKAGRQVLEDFRSKIPHSAKSGGKVVPAKIADGEYVFPEAFVTALGKGDNKRGAEILDGMREKIRAHKRRAPLDKIPPKAKSPLQYMKA